MPDHVFLCHQFVGKSRFVLSSVDEDIYCYYNCIDEVLDRSDDSEEGETTNDNESTGVAAI